MARGASHARACEAPITCPSLPLLLCAVDPRSFSKPYGQEEERVPLDRPMAIVERVRRVWPKEGRGHARPKGGRQARGLPCPRAGCVRKRG